MAILNIIIDDETGEVLEEKKYKEGTILKPINEPTQEQIRGMVSKTDMENYTNSLGGFTHMGYIKNELLFNELGISSPNITRLIYLSTFLDYDTNYLVKYIGQGGKKVKMLKKDIYDELGKTRGPIGERTIRAFMKEVKEIGLLIEFEDGTYKLDDKYFSKGKNCGKNKFKEGEYTRIFKNTTRELYRGCRTSEHKTLGYLYRMIPKLEYDWNKIVVDSKDKSSKGLNIKEIAKFLGIKDSQQNISKLKSSLIKFEIYDTPVFGRIRTESKRGKADFFVINPQVVYRGNNYENVKETLKMLEMFE